MPVASKKSKWKAEICKFYLNDNLKKNFFLKMQFSGNLKSPLLKNATVECLSFIIYVCMIYVLVKYWFYFYFSAKEVLLILIN